MRNSQVIVEIVVYPETRHYRHQIATFSYVCFLITTVFDLCIAAYDCRNIQLKNKRAVNFNYHKKLFFFSITYKVSIGGKRTDVDKFSCNICQSC